MASSTIDTTAGGLGTGSTYADYMGKLADLYKQDNTDSLLSSFKAKQDANKAQDVGKIQGLQESYGMTGSGQEVRDLSGLMKDYQQQYQDYVLSTNETNKNQQIQGLTQLAGMAATQANAATDDARYAAGQERLDAATATQQTQSDQSLFLQSYNDYMSAGKDTPETAMAKAAADFKKITGRDYMNSAGTVSTPTPTDPSTPAAPGAPSTPAAPAFDSMPSTSDPNAWTNSIQGAPSAVQLHSGQDIGQKILYDNHYANAATFEGQALYDELNKVVGPGLFNDDTDIKNYISGKQNINMGGVSKDSANTALTSLSKAIDPTNTESVAFDLNPANTSGSYSIYKERTIPGLKGMGISEEALASDPTPEINKKIADLTHLKDGLPGGGFGSTGFGLPYDALIITLKGALKEYSNYKTSERKLNTLKAKAETLKSFTDGMSWLDKQALQNLGVV